MTIRPNWSGPVRARGRLVAVLALSAGLVLAGGLAARAGWDAVATVLSRLSVEGLAAVCLVQVGAIVGCATAWRTVLPGGSLPALVGSRAIRDGVSSVLAILPGLGEAAGIRALAVFGTPPAPATASGLVDLAAEILSQALFTMIGVVALLALSGGAEAGRGTAILAAAAVPTVAFVALLGTAPGHALLVRLLARLGQAGAPVAGELGQEVAAEIGRLVGQRRRVAACTLLHLAAWFLSAVQIWVAALALDHPLSGTAALALAAMAHAVRGVFFVVPWGAGVQEAGFVVAGAMVGMDEPTAFAISLVTRARDLVLGLPALGLWAFVEARAAATNVRGA